MTLTDQPAVYVGTYGKYAAGSIAGRWLQLEDYASRDEFLAACNELHKNEAEPELMFQDWQSIPEGMISESHIDAELWDWLDLSEDDQEMVAAFRENITDGTIEQARESFRGAYKDEEDFAMEWAEETGAIQATLRWPHNCIDWEQATRELMQDFFSIDRNGKTYIFRND